MARKKLTDRAVKLLKARSERYEVWDSSAAGFGVRVSPTGRKSWIYLYRFEGRPRRMTLGTYPRVSLATARAHYGNARELLEEHGRDPGAEKVGANRAHRDAPTVNDLVDIYMEKWAKPRKRSWKEDERILNNDVRPAIGRKKAADVVRRDIIEILDSVVERGAPIAANKTLAITRKMFRFGLSQDLVPHNPCEAVQAPAETKCRDRVLSSSEVKKLWRVLEGDAVRMTPGVRLCLNLILVTAQRRAEVVSATWSDIDMATGWWTIPEEVAKNKLAHRVPISPVAKSLFKKAKQLSGDSGFVFPNPSGKRHIRADAISKAVRRNEAVFQIDHFAPHDLRRTAASHMASAGTPRLTIGKILNHVESGVTAVYDRHSYDQEKRKALNAWGRKLESITTGRKAKVIELKTG